MLLQAALNRVQFKKEQGSFKAATDYHLKLSLLHFPHKQMCNLPFSKSFHSFVSQHVYSLTCTLAKIVPIS